MFASQVASMTSPQRQQHEFWCPNKSCPGSPKGHYTKFSHRGGTKQPHFAHVAGSDSEHCGETMIHAWASEIVGQTHSLSVPARESVTDVMTVYASSMKKLSCEPIGTNSTYTKIGRAYHSDAVIGHNGQLIYIEITYRHITTDRKTAYCRQNQIPVLEIDLRQCRNYEEQDFVEYVLHLAPRRWLSHPTQAADDKRAKEEEDAAEAAYQKKYAEIAKSTCRAKSREQADYEHRRSTISMAYNLPVLTSVAPQSRWFGGGPDREAQWLLDLTELSILEPLRKKHGKIHRNSIFLCGPGFYDEMGDIVSPEMVELARSGEGKPFGEKDIDAEVMDALESVFSNVAGISRAPRAKRFDFEEATKHSLGLLGKVLFLAQRISQAYQDAGPLVLKNWVDNSGVIRPRRSSEVNGGANHLRYLIAADHRLFDLLRQMINPSGIPTDLVGFDNLPDVFNFTPPANGIERHARSHGAGRHSELYERCPSSLNSSSRFRESLDGKSHGQHASLPSHKKSPSQIQTESLKNFRKICGDISEKEIEELTNQARENYSQNIDAKAALRFLALIEDDLILHNFESHWKTAPQAAFEGLSRREYVEAGGNASEIWKRVKIAIGLNLKAIDR